MRLFRNAKALIFLVLTIIVFTAFASAQFETRSTSSVMNQPESSAVADFNHDGKPDLVTGLGLSSKLAVLLGNGDGTFRAATYYDLDGLGRNGSASSVAVTDFNRDGNMDIVAVDRLTTNVYLLLGNGDGTFQPPQPFATIGRPFFIGSGDFNGDGLTDVITVNDLCECINVLLGNGDGTFQAPIRTNPGGVPPSVIGIGDFNHDGKLDVAAAGQQFTLSEVVILLGNGDGTFQSGATYSLGPSPESIAVADFRRIGKLDLAIANGFGEISVLLGNGDGTFQTPVDYPVPFATSLNPADLNGDGKIDLALLAEPVSNIATASIMLGNGDGTFQPLMSFSSGNGDTFLTVGDLNQDGRTDLIVPSGLGVDVLLNTGVVAFSPTTPISFNPQLVGTASTPLNVTLTNTGVNTLSMEATKVTGPFQLGGDTTCATSVPAGATCTLSVIFEPSGTGVKSGLIQISDDASTKPQVIELSGTGTVLTVSPSSLNFGSQKVGTKSTPQDITVTNTGHNGVTVSSLTIAGNTPFDYSQTNTCGKRIAPEASCTITVTFGPLAKGTRSATLEILGSGAIEYQLVALIGIGD